MYIEKWVKNLYDLEKWLMLIPDHMLITDKYQNKLVLYIFIQWTMMENDLTSCFLSWKSLRKTVYKDTMLCWMTSSMLHEEISCCFQMKRYSTLLLQVIIGMTDWSVVILNMFLMCWNTQTVQNNLEQSSVHCI